MSRICQRCGRSFAYTGAAMGKGMYCSHRCANDGNRSLEERFWPMVLKTESCWLWQGAICGAGYGHMGVDGKTKDAHRLAWEMTRGPIPAGMRVLHNCPGGDRRDCCRPDHLWLGTQADNMRDMWAKGRGHTSSPGGERNGKAKLTRTQVEEIRVLAKATSLTQRAIATRYGVTPQTIGRILGGKSWKPSPVGDPLTADEVDFMEVIIDIETRLVVGHELPLALPARLGGAS